MAFGFGKKWWKRASGLSNVQRKVSRAIGVPLSGKKSVKLTSPLAWLFGGSARKKDSEVPKQQAKDAAIAEKERTREELKKQAEDAAVAKEKEKEWTREELKKQAEDAAVAKEKKLESLSGQITKATSLLGERVDAWRQAGSPDIQQKVLDGAKEKADGFLAVLRDARGKQALTSIKIGYFNIAYFARKSAKQLGMPWFVAALITGAVLFPPAILLAILLTENLVVTFAFGGIGFLAGFVPTSFLLLVPNNKDAQAIIGILRQQKSDNVEPLDAAKRDYQEAQEDYEKLASLFRLKSDCEIAYQRKQRLEGEHQATRDG